MVVIAAPPRATAVCVSIKSFTVAPPKAAALTTRFLSTSFRRRSGLKHKLSLRLRGSTRVMGVELETSFWVLGLTR